MYSNILHNENLFLILEWIKLLKVCKLILISEWNERRTRGTACLICREQTERENQQTGPLIRQVETFWPVGGFFLWSEHRGGLWTSRGRCWVCVKRVELMCVCVCDVFNGRAAGLGGLAQRGRGILILEVWLHLRTLDGKTQLMCPRHPEDFTNWVIFFLFKTL